MKKSFLSVALALVSVLLVAPPALALSEAVQVEVGWHDEAHLAEVVMPDIVEVPELVVEAAVLLQPTGSSREARSTSEPAYDLTAGIPTLASGQHLTDVSGADPPI